MRLRLHHGPIPLIALALFACTHKKAQPSTPAKQQPISVGCSSSSNVVPPDDKFSGSYSHPGNILPTLIGGTQTIRFAADGTGASPGDIKMIAASAAFTIEKQTLNAALIRGNAVGNGFLEVETADGNLLDEAELSVDLLVSGGAPPLLHVSSLPLALWAHGTLILPYQLQGPAGPIVDESMTVTATNALAFATSWDVHSLTIGDAGIVDIDAVIGGVSQLRVSLPIVASDAEITLATTLDEVLTTGTLSLGQTLSLCAYATSGSYEVDAMNTIVASADGQINVTKVSGDAKHPACFTVEALGEGAATLHLSTSGVMRDYALTVVSSSTEDMNANLDLGTVD